MSKYIKTESGYKTVDEIDSLVEIKDTADRKMNATDPVGEGSFSMGRKLGTVVGSYSHAEGDGTTASGYYSHAEGYETTASQTSSHAEGYETTASGYSSHAEGYGTTASQTSSHAEGRSTEASGYSSHAEGYGTTAQGDSQHVQGEYNILDTEGSAISRGKYAHIVGNGTSSARSNAHTLDWDGNAWYQGDIYVGSTSGTNMDDGSKKLATEEYVDNAIKKCLISITASDSDIYTLTLNDNGIISTASLKINERKEKDIYTDSSNISQSQVGYRFQFSYLSEKTTMIDNLSNSLQNNDIIQIKLLDNLCQATSSNYCLLNNNIIYPGFYFSFGSVLVRIDTYKAADEGGAQEPD